VLIFKLLHILSMFTMVTIFIGGEVLVAFTISRRDVHGLATLERLETQSRLPYVGLGALLAGIGFGLLAAATGGLDFFTGWLIAAYLLVALFFVNIAVLGRGVVGLMRSAAEADAGQRPVEEVVREMATRRGTIFFVVNVVIFASIIADMVLKPF
jgi:predicted integral membrane protein DUF2269